MGAYNPILMNNSLSKIKKISLLLALVVVAATNNKSFAQNTTSISRVAITVADSKTSIWISDFPKKTTVMLIDGDNNLLGIISTNEYGAAYTSFSKPVLSVITARTLNGEINVNNKAVLKSEKIQEAVAVSENKIDNKA
jgi:hypothetical protein